MSQNFHCIKVLALILGLFISGNSYSGVFETREFETTVQSDRYRTLIAELRCLVCQNQNIADSNADLATDLRDKVYELIVAGQSDADIVNFMVIRYGDFVLYRPPLKASTVVLWLSPFVLVILSIGLLIRFIRNRRNEEEVPTQLSDEQRLKASQLLTTNANPSHSTESGR